MSYSSYKTIIPARFHRYTKFVRFMKAFLWVFATTFLIIIILLPLTNKERAGVRLIFTAESDIKTTDPIMRNPKYRGVDAKMQPYIVTADYAIQEDKNNIILNNLQADMTMKDKSWLSVSADQGTLNLQNEILHLIGKVYLLYNNGYVMETEAIEINMVKNEAHSISAVHGKGDFGNINAKEFYAYERGNHLIFKNKVILKIKDM